MNLLFDTNILVYLAKSPYYQKIKETLNPKGHKVYVSVTTIAELRSIALQNNWGIKKLQVVKELLEEITVIEVSENLANIYAEIDAFSQCKNPSFSHYSFKTSRNMGKNDIWIASTAALLGLKLLTTDKDFSHLNSVYIEIQDVNPELFKQQLT